MSQACGVFVVLLVSCGSEGLLLSHFVCKMEYRFSKLFFLTSGMVGFGRSGALQNLARLCFFYFVPHPLPPPQKMCFESFQVTSVVLEKGGHMTL